MSKTNPTMWTQVTAVGLLSAILASGGTYAVTQAARDDAPVVVEAAPGPNATASNASYSPGAEWSGLADTVSPSVVAIGVESVGGQGAGSGVIWDTDGHIVTNAHVVHGADTVQVSLSDGRAYEAEVTGSDPSTDLAVLTLPDPPDDLRPIDVGDDSVVGVGDPVMAIGNPLGLSGTVTTGIVSAVDRPVTTAAAGDEEAVPGATQPAEPVVTNAIQTSAAINPGNSGGALVDADGALIGINSSIASLSGAGGQGGNIGIGFAIPVGKVSSVADQLIAGDPVEHAFLGVGLTDASAEADGATLFAAGVSQVEEGSPAASAGLQEGDAITSIDGERVNGSLALVAQVRQRDAGDEVVLEFVRGDAAQEVTVTLDARADG